MLRIRLNTLEKRRDCQLWTLGGDVGPAVSQSIPPRTWLGRALGAVMNSLLETNLIRLDSKALKSLHLAPPWLRWALLSYPHLKHKSCKCLWKGFSGLRTELFFRDASSANQPSVFTPGKSHGQRGLAGYSPWGHKRFRHDWATKQQQIIITTEMIDSYKANGREIQKRGDTCICIAESLCCRVETNTTMYSNYTPIKINFKKLPSSWPLLPTLPSKTILPKAFPIQFLASASF